MSLLNESSESSEKMSDWCFSSSSIVCKNLLAMVSFDFKSSLKVLLRLCSLILVFLRASFFLLGACLGLFGSKKV